MVYTCFLCKWRGDKFPRRSYHKFPTNADLKQKWLDILGKSNVSIGARTSLCSIHFDEDCFRYGLVNGRRILKDGSIPTLHLTNDIQEQTIDLVDEISHPEPYIESVGTEHPLAEVAQTVPQTHRKETEDIGIKDVLQCILCARSITEFRYTCVQCSDLDLCGACEADRAHHHHYVLRIPAERPANEVQFVLDTIRRCLQSLDCKTISEPDCDGPSSIKSEIKSEGEDDEEMAPRVQYASDSAVLWTACRHREHTNCFTNIGIKLEPINEGDSVHFSSADEGDSSDGNGMGKGDRDAGTDCGTSNAHPTSSHTATQDETTSAETTCVTSISSGHVDVKTLEKEPKDDINQKPDVANNSADHTPSKKSRSIKKSTNFTNIDDVEFIQTYRMSKKTVIEICKQIDKDLEFSGTRGERIASLLQLLIALRYYGIGPHLKKIASGHGVSLSTASRVVKKVSSVIVKLKNKYIHMPTADELEICQEEFCSIANFPSVIGCIDSTHVRIKSSAGNTDDVFKNKKAYCSVNVQMVVDSKLRIRDVVAHSPGSNSDAKVFEDCELNQQFETGKYGNACLLGDSAYPSKNYLLTPYLQPTTEAQERYNKSHSETRKVVDTLYSMLKRRFPALAVGLRLNFQTAVNVVTACCILHNICVENGEAVPPPDINSAVLEAHLQHGSIVEVYDKPGEDDRRNEITRDYFSGTSVKAQGQRQIEYQQRKKRENQIEIKKRESNAEYQHKFRENQKTKLRSETAESTVARKSVIGERTNKHRENKKKKQLSDTAEANRARRKSNAERIKLYRDKLKSKKLVGYDVASE